MLCMGTESNSRLPTPIANMGPWDFWASPYAIGLSVEDADALAQGKALPEQIDRAQILGGFAKHALMAAPHNEPVRPS
jgi:hypothetical protein